MATIVQAMRTPTTTFANKSLRVRNRSLAAGWLDGQPVIDDSRHSSPGVHRDRATDSCLRHNPLLHPLQGTRRGRGLTPLMTAHRSSCAARARCRHGMAPPAPQPTQKLVRHASALLAMRRALVRCAASRMHPCANCCGCLDAACPKQGIKWG